MESNKFEKYEIITINRKEIKNAPYNPRKITDKAKKKLRENLEKVGLLAPIVWNKRTGNIVSGHQRVAALDTLLHTKDYMLKVAMVDIDEKTEKEQCIFMNNPEAQGYFDLEKLEELIKVDQIDFELAGFDIADIYQTFGDSPLLERPEKLKELSEQLRKSREIFRSVEKKLLEKDDDDDYYLVVVFKNYEDRKKFLDALNLPDNRFQNGMELQKLLTSHGQGKGEST